MIIISINALFIVDTMAIEFNFFKVNVLVSLFNEDENNA